MPGLPPLLLRALPALPWILLLALAALLYVPSLTGGFLFDDAPNIVDNPAIRLTEFSLAGLADSLTGVSAGPLGRPVSVSSFALTHLFFGLDPFAFKAINLVLHLANALLVGWFVRLLLDVLPGQPGERMRRWLPFWVAAAWLLHPIQFVAVSMAVQRMTLLAAGFTWLALIAHLQATRSPDGRTRWAWAGAAWLVCWPLAFLSKETGLLFPALALLIAWFAKPDTTAGRRMTLILGSGALVLIGVAMFWKIGVSWLAAGYAVRDFTPTERLLTQARLLWFHLGQILAPTHGAFSIYLDWFPISRGIFAPHSTALALAAWAVVTVLAWRYVRRQPILFFGLGWFLVGHSLESSFIPLEIAHEHRNYLPSLGPLLALGWYGVRLAEFLDPARRPLMLSIAAAAALATLATLTGLRARQMADPLLGAQIEAARHENSARANYVAGFALIKAGFGDRDDPIGANQVRFFFEQAERADRSFKLGYLGLITWACASGRMVEREWLDEFARRLEDTPFSHGQRGLAADLLKPLIAMPECLSHSDAFRLFEAGSRNQRLRNELRAGFLEAGADYALLVAHDPARAHAYLARASALQPRDARLTAKRTALEGVR